MMAKITVNGAVLEGTAVELAEFMKRMSEGESDDLSAYEVGDYVVITEDTDEHCEGEFAVIREIDRKSYDSYPLGINTPDGDYNGWTHLESVRKATEEEIAELTKPKVSVGDFVKVVADSTGRNDGRVGWSERGQGLMRIGAIGEVIEVKDGKIVVSFDDEQPGSAQLDKRKKFILVDGEYEKLSAEESAKAVFTKAGRKPNEYKKGDIGRITATYGAPYKVGQLIEVAEMFHDPSDHNSVRLADGYCVSIEPVVFVENRLDRQ